MQLKAADSDTALVSTRRLLLDRAKKDERGAIAVLFALTLVILFAIAALSVDASLWFERRNRLSAASDGAAVMAAIEVQRNPSVSNPNLQTFGGQVVTTHGFNPANLTLNRPPSSGPFAGNSQYVETFVSETTQRFFANVWGPGSATPAARAVAGTSSSANCFITFEAMDWDNNDTLNAANCDVSIGGNLDLGNGTIINASHTAVSGIKTGGGTAANLSLNVPHPSDPLATLPVPPNPPGGCIGGGPLNVSSNMTINPGEYCGFLFSGNNRTLTLNAGIYYVTGPITASTPGKDVIIRGTGVMIFIAPGGSINLDSNFVDIQLSAPTSGTYKGIVFFQDRANSADAMFAKNNSDITLNGAMYFPNSNVTMKNNGLTGNPCGLVVAKTVTLKNNATFNINNTCADFGGSPLMTVSLAE